jgi:hypothetical protein
MPKVWMPVSSAKDVISFFEASLSEYVARWSASSNAYAASSVAIGS